MAVETRIADRHRRDQVEHRPMSRSSDARRHRRPPAGRCRASPDGATPGVAAGCCRTGPPVLDLLATYQRKGPSWLRRPLFFGAFWMGIEGTFLPPQPKRLPVDGLGHSRRHPGIAGQRAEHGPAAQLPAFERQAHVELSLTASGIDDCRGQLRPGLRQVPLVLHVHVHKWRHVKILGMAESQLR